MGLWCLNQQIEARVNNKQYAQTGRYMFIIAWLIFFVLLFVFFRYYNQSEQGSYYVEHGTVV